MRQPPITRPSSHADHLASIERQLAQDPENAQLHAQAAFCLSHMGNYRRMLAEAKKAVELDSENAWHHHLVSVAYRRLGRPRAAKQAIDVTLRLEPENPIYHLSFAEFLGERGRWKSALAESEAALRLNPEDEDTLAFRAHALSILGQRDEAMEVARGALREDPDSPAAHTQLGWLHLHAGRQHEAQNAFREALRLDPEYAEAHRGLLMSLRAIFPPYRWLIQISTWLERQPPGAQAMTGVLAYPIVRVCVSFAHHYPAALPFLAPVIAFLGGLITLRFFGAPVANVALLFHPLGSLALGRRRRNESAAMGVVMAVALIGALVSVLSRTKCWISVIMAVISFVLMGILARENERLERKKHPWAFGYWLSAGCSVALLALDLSTNWESASHFVL